MRFLSSAEETLRKVGRPLSDKSLVQIARDEGRLVTDGLTPAATMRARLSQDLRLNGFGSRFQRVGPNRFALREWGLREYLALPFIKSIPDEAVVAVRDTATEEHLHSFGFSAQPLPAVLDYLSNPTNLVFLPRPQAEGNDSVRQLISYVVLRSKCGSVLTYRRGRFSAAHSMLRGARCIGFGGHVQVQDANDLFGRADGGLILAAQREIHEELEGVRVNSIRPLGIINDKSSPEGVKHLGVVLEASLPADFDVQMKSRERAVNDLRLVPVHELAENFYEFEFWSQLLIREIVPDFDRLYHQTVIRPSKRIFHTDAMVVVGEIASGKTTLVRALQEQFGLVAISTRACVSEIIGVPDFGVAERAEFQREAANLVANSAGVHRLAEVITKHAQFVTGTRVIDGIRNLA